jgi:hypothetical protein
MDAGHLPARPTFRMVTAMQDLDTHWSAPVTPKCQIETQVVINAPPQVVWDVLVDFDNPRQE